MNHTERVILAGRSGANAWTSATLARWGVPWPPPTGWRAKLIEGDLLADHEVRPGAPAKPKKDRPRRVTVEEAERALDGAW